MNIALIGYGRMGKEVERIALDRNHQVLFRIDNSEQWPSPKELKNVNVAVEFSNPTAAVNNILRCFSHSLPVVCGTTGWNDQLNEISQVCRDKNQAFFYAPNFSLGMNIFFEVNKLLAQLMFDRQEYEVTIEEVHHSAKLDSPSGTAVALANEIISRLGRKKNWVNQQPTKPEELYIRSVRTGLIPGTHLVSYDSDYDTIEIRHDAKNRRGFALGAVMAAEWIKDKKGVFGMHDMMYGKCQKQ